MEFLHERPDFSKLVVLVSDERNILPQLVEKDYWIMHCLWGLQQCGYDFELKGGTSLSKGFDLIHRFSEDIDIHIAPPEGLRTWKNHNKERDIKAREAFYDEIAKDIQIPGILDIERDHAFDDEKFRSGGIRLRYKSRHGFVSGLKDGVLLEAGFDQVTPNRPCDISSWVFDKALEAGVADIKDNRAIGVKCYEPGYTLIEKLQTISTKYRRQQATGEMPTNFLRHYYDVYCLLGFEDVVSFLGSEDYAQHKAKRFRQGDDPDITANEAFVLSDSDTRKAYETSYRLIGALFYETPPEFEEILERLSEYASRL